MKNINNILVLMLLSSSVTSQTFEVKFDHTALPVKDLVKSADFYSGILNLNEIDTPGNNPILRWFDLGNDKQLHLIEGNDDVKLSKGVHFALHVDDFDAFITHLKVKGIPFENWNGEISKSALRPDTVRQIYIQDPDGNWIEINDAKY